MSPFDYSLCDQSVTVYRKRGDTITRRVAENAYFQPQVSTPTESYGKSRSKEFLLIIPGDFPLQPGDRVYRGIGPVVVDWEAFIPAWHPELFAVSFSKPCYWESEITHWEAGNRKEHL